MLCYIAAASFARFRSMASVFFSSSSSLSFFSFFLQETKIFQQPRQEKKPAGCCVHQGTFFILFYFIFLFFFLLLRGSFYFLKMIFLFAGDCVCRFGAIVWQRRINFFLFPLAQLDSSNSSASFFRRLVCHRVIFNKELTHGNHVPL